MTATNVRVQMQQRRDTAANWTSANPTLLSGELGYETDTNKFKIGNGTAAWSALAYVPGFSISAYPLATADIADNAITTAKIADDAVTAAKIANTSVTAGSYTTANITVDAQGRVTSAASGASAPPDGSITTAKLANDAVTGDKLANDITIANNLTVTNDLTVNGTTTTIDSTTLVVEDKNIEIGKVSTPSDTTADGGGITLKGATDKTLTWVDSTDCWTFNQGLNLTAGTAGAPALVFNGDVDSGLFQPGADSLAIATGGTQRITVDSSGNIGIGLTSPQTRFHSSGTTNGAQATFGITSSGLKISTFQKTGNDAGVILDAQESTNGTLAFNTRGAERMRLDSSGRLLLGTTTQGTAAADDLTIATSGNTGITIRSGTSNSGTLMFADGTSGSASYRAEISYYHNDDAMAFTTNGGSEAMRLDSSGRVLIAKSASNFANVGIELRENGEIVVTRSGGDVITTRRLVSEGTHFSLRNISGTSVGTIVTTSSSTAYNTSSDYRLKENVVDSADGITRVKQLSPKRFNFIADADTTVDGFLAHEAQAVVPEAVTGKKDGEEMQGIDQAKLVPLLTAALQEAIGEIETLKQRLSDAGIA